MALLPKNYIFLEPQNIFELYEYKQQNDYHLIIYLRKCLVSPLGGGRVTSVVFDVSIPAALAGLSLLPVNSCCGIYFN